MIEINELHRYPVVCIDTETTGLDWGKDRVFGVAIAVPDCSMEQLLHDPIGAPISTRYFDVRTDRNSYVALRNVAPKLQKYVNHNAKFDAHMTLNDGVILDPTKTECTTMRACLINEHLVKYELDFVAKKCLGMGKQGDIYQELADLFGGRVTKAVQMRNIWQAPSHIVAKYAERDAEVALRLWAWQETEIKRQDLGRVWDLERRLYPHIFDMERGGIRVDMVEAERQTDILTQKIETLQRDLDNLAGFAVNPNPSGSMAMLFKPVYKEGHWYASDGTPLQTTEAGKPSFNKEVLESMRHPAAGMILRLRKLLKTRDTFIGGHILGHARNGRVHPNINQTKGDETGGTGTGRLSYTNPALQQIPARDKEIAAIVRPIFLPEVGHGWTYGDLDQHELRIFHHYVQNPNVLKSYRENPNLDGHGIVAQLTGLPRNAPKSGGANAKQINLAMVFNMGGGELADRMGLPWTWERFTDTKGEVHEYKKAGPEAEAIMNTYYDMVPGVKEIAQKARSIAKTRGHVKTLFGRHIRFPGGMFTHKASGLVYQGTSADLNKDNIIRVTEYLKQECPEARVLLNIHDETSSSLPYSSDWRKLCRGMRDVIQDRPEIRVPLRIDFSELAPNWWEATKAPVVE